MNQDQYIVREEMSGTAKDDALVVPAPLAQADASALLPGMVTPSDLREVYETWLAGKAEHTRRGYRRDWIDLARYLNPGVTDPDPVAAIRALIAAGPGAASLTVMRYLADLRNRRRLTPATRNRRLYALRSLFDLAQLLGVVPWTLRVRGERVVAYRDVSGPRLPAVQRMMDEAAASGAAASRDVVLLHLLYSCGLRRSEVTTCDVKHYDRGGARLQISGKGRDEQREWISLPPQVVEVLNYYLAERGSPPSGPLIASRDPTIKGTGGLTPSGLYTVIRRLAERAGLPRIVSPHRIRHSAVSEGLRGTGGDLSRVQSFARHRSPATTARYNDALLDVGGEVACLLASGLGSVRLLAESPIINNKSPPSVALSEEGADATVGPPNYETGHLAGVSPRSTPGLTPIPGRSDGAGPPCPTNAVDTGCDPAATTLSGLAAGPGIGVSLAVPQDRVEVRHVGGTDEVKR